MLFIVSLVIGEFATSSNSVDSTPTPIDRIRKRRNLSQLNSNEPSSRKRLRYKGKEE